MSKLKNKIALITGASRGIGMAVAKAYAKEGAHVILVGRTVSGLEEVDDYVKSIGGKSTIVPLDLNEFNKIDELGGVIHQRFGKLDILVCNAGMLGVLSPLPHIDTKTWQKVFDINVTANYRLIRSFDPLLRQSDNGRVISVSSSILKSITPYWGLYSASKSALETLTMTYAKEVQQTNIKANIIRPKGTATKMLAEAMPGIDMETVDKPEDLTDLFIKLSQDDLTENGEIFSYHDKL